MRFHNNEPHLKNPFQDFAFFQKTDKNGRVQHFLVGSPTIIIWLFLSNTLCSLSLSHFTLRLEGLARTYAK